MFFFIAFIKSWWSSWCCRRTQPEWTRVWRITWRSTTRTCWTSSPQATTMKSSWYPGLLAGQHHSQLIDNYDEHNNGVHVSFDDEGIKEEIYSTTKIITYQSFIRFHTWCDKSAPWQYWWSLWFDDRLVNLGVCLRGESHRIFSQWIFSVKQRCYIACIQNMSKLIECQ